MSFITPTTEVAEALIFAMLARGIHGHEWRSPVSKAADKAALIEDATYRGPTRTRS